jgi:hypothetical protein
MTFVDTGRGFGGPTFSGNPFGGSTITPGGFGPPGGAFGGPGFGGGQSKLTGTNAPGTVSPFDQQAVGNALNLNEQAMTNRYAQLGLSSAGATPTSPGGPAGGIGVGNIGKGLLPPQGGAGTPTAEQQDLGMLPSLTGGLPGEAEATLGLIQNANLQQPQSSGGGGKGGGGKGGIGQIAGLAGMLGGK